MMRTSLPGLLVRGMLAVAVCAMGLGTPVRAEEQKSAEPKAQTPQTPAERLHAEVRRILADAKCVGPQYATDRYVNQPNGPQGPTDPACFSITPRPS